MKKRSFFTFVTLVLITASLSNAAEVNRAMLGMFQPLMEQADNPENPVTAPKVDLGRMLYFDKRLSKDHSVSCNSCHDLASFGDDGAPVSTGIGKQKGGRSAPTVYNAAIHISQFWDGRAKDVEAQAVGPITNPIEMGMPDSDYVLKVVNSIPGYVAAFKAAFPKEENPVTYENIGNAIGAFERKLLTPAPFDAFLKGDDSALTESEQDGLNLFMTTGCSTCHNGMGVGGHFYQKLGLVKEWPTEDLGRYESTKVETDKYFFKVPSLRNITETAPYLHDGSEKSLEGIVGKMAEYQMGRILAEEDVASIVTFLGALKGEIDADFIAEPMLPESGPDTPKASE